MMKTDNSDEIARLHTHYNLLISQLKSERDAFNEKWKDKIIEMSRL